jgi:hypothetical protein
MTDMYYFSEQGLAEVQNEDNMKDFCQKMAEHPHDTNWLPDLFDSNPLIKSRFSFDFCFVTGDKDPESYDYDNAIRLYKLFKGQSIPNSIVFNEKFLVGFIFTYGYQYFLWRHGAEHANNMLFFSQGTRRAISFNAVGRLYKLVLMTYDEGAEDPLWLTKFAFSSTTMKRLVYYTYMDANKVSLAFTEAMKRWSDENKIVITNELFESARKHLSLLYNVNVVEDMERQEVVSYVLDYLKKIAAPKN